MAKIHDILSLSPEKLRRKRIGKRRRRHEPKRYFTEQELVDYLIKNGIKSANKLAKHRQRGDPTVYDCIKEFGSWATTKERCYGPENPIQTGIEIDARFLVKTVIMGNLWTFRKYLAARKKHPDVVPSNYYIQKFFGRFASLTSAAKLYSVQMLMKAYRKLQRQLGRPPLVKELAAEGIDMGKALEFFKGDRKAMNCFLQQLESESDA